MRHAVPQLPVVCSSAAPYFSHHPPIPASFEPSGTTPAQGYDRNTQESNQRLRNIFATLHYSVLQCQGSSHRSALEPTTIRRLVRGERADCVIFNCKACWRGETKKKKKPLLNSLSLKTWHKCDQFKKRQKKRVVQICFQGETVQQKLTSSLVPIDCFLAHFCQTQLTCAGTTHQALLFGTTEVPGKSSVLSS